jgi:hypothetical protein
MATMHGVCSSIFFLQCYLWESIAVICEFDVVEFDVGSGLVEEGVVGLEAFNGKNVWPVLRWAYAWGGGTNARE